jgi:hypothetical protein
MRWWVLFTLVACAPSAPTQPTVVIPMAAAAPNATPSPTPHPRARRSWHDRDGDGVPDDVDKCPDHPEDLDGFEDDDGCPDPDNDQDGVRDVDDQCPNIAGPPPDGCPRARVSNRNGDGGPDQKP